MINELKSVKDNAQYVNKQAFPQQPILLFSLNGQGTSYDKDSWRDFHENLAEKNPQVELVQVDSSHYLHNIASQELAQAIKDFLDSTT